MLHIKFGVHQNLCPIVQDRYKFSSDMKTYDMTYPQDKIIFNLKKIEEQLRIDFKLQ